MSARWVDSLLEWICLPFCRSVRHLLHANRLEFLPYRMIIGIYCREWVLGILAKCFRIRGVIPSGPPSSLRLWEAFFFTLDFSCFTFFRTSSALRGMPLTALTSSAILCQARFFIWFVTSLDKGLVITSSLAVNLKSNDYYNVSYEYLHTY